MSFRTLAPGLSILIATSAMAQPTTQWSDLANTSWYDAQENTFTLSTPEELAGLAQLVAGGNAFPGKTINLANDLDLGAHLWSPIGPDYLSPFSGTVNGNDHVISNLYVVLPDEDWVGLFGMVTNSTLEHIRINGAYVRGYSTVGSLVGNASTNSTVTDCHATGVDLVAGDYNVGGLAGSIMTNSTMARCSAEGSVTGSSQVGGLVGSPWDLTNISESWSAGTVSGEYLVGGLIGFCTFAFGPNRDNTLNNCYSRASASAVIGRAGGLYGGNQGGLIISNCYATGTATAAELTGGFIGVSGGMSVTNSYWDTQTSQHTEGIGGWEGPQTPQEISGKTTLEMKSAGMVDSLNSGQTDGPWTINASVNDGYPAFEDLTTGVSVAQTNHVDVTVQPTLFTTTVQLTAHADLLAYQLFDATGKLVAGAALYGTSRSVDLSRTAPGAYVLKVLTREGAASRRIVKQ